MHVMIVRRNGTGVENSPWGIVNTGPSLVIFMAAVELRYILESASFQRVHAAEFHGLTLTSTKNS